MENLISIQDLSISFGGLIALSDLNFSITGSKISSIIGPNGAGKTTLFNILSGLLRPQLGQVIWKQEHNLLGMKPHEICYLGIGRTFQNVRLFPEMSVLENVMIGLHTLSKIEILSGIFQPKRARKEEDNLTSRSLGALDKMGLKDRAYELAKNLPYGQQRLLEIARAMVAEPKLVLLDEPCAGLNRKEKEDLKEKIQQFKTSGTAVLLIEHDMKVVMGISDKLIVLDHGEKIFDGLPSEARVDPRVIAAYLGSGKADA